MSKLFAPYHIITGYWRKDAEDCARYVSTGVEYVAEVVLLLPASHKGLIRYKGEARVVLGEKLSACWGREELSLGSFQDPDLRIKHPNGTEFRKVLAEQLERPEGFPNFRYRILQTGGFTSEDQAKVFLDTAISDLNKALRAEPEAYTPYLTSTCIPTN